VDCHVTDLKSLTGNLIPMTFQKSCKDCHKRELQFDAYQLLGDTAQESPHTRKQDTIRAFIEKSYRDALAADSSLPQRPIGVDAIVISNPDAWLARVTTDSYEYLFGKKCPYCHQMESRYEVKKIDPTPPESPTAPEQAPLGILGRYPLGQPWFERSEFSHRSHREVECESCHAAARNSEKTEDVLIPVMKSCLPCHGETRADLDRCSECHLYHNRTLERERDRRPTDKIIGQMPGSPDVARTLVSAAPRLVSALLSGPEDRPGRSSPSVRDVSFHVNAGTCAGPKCAETSLGAADMSVRATLRTVHADPASGALARAVASQGGPQ
jgi:hypothetical protein